MIEITCNDRLGKKVRVKCNPDDTILDLKKLIALQIGTHYQKIILKKWYRIFNDNVTLADCKYQQPEQIVFHFLKSQMISMQFRTFFQMKSTTE